MNHQIPHYYPNTDASYQEYALSPQPPLTPIPEFSSPSNHPHLSQVWAYAGTHSSQSQLQQYQPLNQRTSRIHSEPIYPSQLTHNQDYIPQNLYPAPSAPQHRRTFSAGAYPQHPASFTALEISSPAVAIHGQNSTQAPDSLFSSASPIWMRPQESPAGLGWPTQTAVLDQYLAPPSQEQRPFGNSQWPDFSSFEPEQSPDGFVGDHEVAQNLPYGLNQPFETYGTSESEGLSLQGQTAHLERAACMRPAPYPDTRTYIPREEAQRFIQPPLVEPSDSIPTPIQYQPPRREICTPADPQPPANLRQAAEHTNARSQYGRLGHTPIRPADDYAAQLGDPDTKTYVDVGVQTDPEPPQPATRHTTGKTLGRSGATMGGRKYKFVQSNVAGRSNRSTPAPKRAPQAQKKLPPAQPAHSLQTASESRPPLPKLRIDPTAASSSGTSHQDHNMAHTLGPNRPQVPQDGTSNQNLAGPVQVPQGPPSAFGVSTFERPTLRAPDNTIPAPSGAPTRPVQQVQALPSPYTPDAGVHQMFTESAAAPRDSAPLINETLPSISQRDFQAGASLRVPSNSGRVVCLPTPDITPDVSGLDQQLVFPPKPLRAGSTETNTSQASVPQTRQANGNHQAGAPTAYQAGVQLQGPTNIPLAVPSIYICDTEDIASSPGRASSRDCAQTGNNLNEAPQSGSQQGSKSSSTHRQSNQFSQASAQKRGNSIDHPPVAQSQHQPAQQQPHDIQKVENHAGDKSRSISAISQYSTIKTFPSQPELVRRDEQRQTQVRSPKRERSTNETSPEQQIKRRRGDELRQSSRDAGEGVPERPAPQAARTDNEAFNVSMWSNPGLPRVIGGAEELPVAGTETTSSGNQYPQGRMQAQGWGPSPKKPCATSNSNMKHAPLSHPTPLPFPTDDCSARVATLGTFTCLMTSHTPSSNNIGSAHTIPATIQPRARRGTEAGIESGAIDLGTPLGSSWLDNTVVLAMQSQRATPQVKGKAIGSSSALQPGCASSTPEIGKGMEHTAVDYPGEQGQVASIPGSTTAPAQHGVMGPYNSSSVSYPRSSADLQEPNAPPIGELNFDELIDYDGVDECEMLSNEGYL